MKVSGQGLFCRRLPGVQLPQVLHSPSNGVVSRSNQDRSRVVVTEVTSGEGALQAPACRGQCIFF